MMTEPNPNPNLWDQQKPEVVINPASTMEQDHAALMMVHEPGVSVSVLDIEDDHALLLEMRDNLQDMLPSPRRNFIQLGNLRAENMGQEVQDAIGHWLLQRGKIDELQTVHLPLFIEDMSMSLKRLAPLVDLEGEVFVAILHAHGTESRPLNWHYDLGVREGHLVSVRSFGANGADFAAKGHFEDVAADQRRGKKDYQVTKFHQTPSGLCVFEGRDVLHRTSGFKSDDGQPRTRWAYLLAAPMRRSL